MDEEARWAIARAAVILSVLEDDGRLIPWERQASIAIGSLAEEVASAELDRAIDEYRAAHAEVGRTSG